ncbi:hypothetical protein [Streptomyces sp. NBC_01314]|uniref:hypothetical protein n=1 Tax=Streptomyces sp. NBC_01314 TaxID=2903821 RepID=UPI003088E138|nr:hypothetical protein OG622_21850 [Streptomyces sp. NBC_01314]
MITKRDDASRGLTREELLALALLRTLVDACERCDATYGHWAVIGPLICDNRI